MKRLLSFLVLIALSVTMVQAGGAKKSKDAKADETDPKTWTPIKIPGQQKAPELEDIEAWLNGPPLTMKELRGKVVVIHFMAFG
jgi:hypothetical protein